jgi:uncharacterized membrane protein (GlpM family)
MTPQFLFKVLLTALIVAGVSELGKQRTFVAAVLASLPLTSVLALTWLYVETSDVKRVGDLSLGILWMVIPSLVFFAALFALLRYGVGYWISLGLAVVITSGAYFGYSRLLAKVGIEL